MTDDNTSILAERPMPYAPAGSGARIWHPFIVLIGGFFTFMFWAVLPQGILGGIDGASGMTDLLDPRSLTTRYALPALAAGFGLILLHFVFWTRTIERRPLASIGLQAPAFAARYIRGLGIGIIFAIIGTVGGAAIATSMGYTVPELAPSTLPRLSETLMLTALLIVPAFLLQAGTEEVVFRGWMLSALSARTSITLAVIVSGAAFGLFHLDRLLVDPTFAAVFMAGTSVMGVFLGVWAVQARSIAGPMGFHGAYNALLMLSSYLEAAANAAPADTGSAVFFRMMQEGMSSAPRYMDYIAVQQTLIVALSIIGIVGIMLSRPSSEND